MNLKELKENVDFIYKELQPYENPEDFTVCVPIDESSVGAGACVAIRYISRGVDWEHSRINIDTVASLVRKGKSKQDIIPPWENEYDYGTGKKTIIRDCKTCGNQTRKNDKYCSNCGQKLK